jgi:putative glutamine amidotransferase
MNKIVYIVFVIIVLHSFNLHKASVSTNSISKPVLLVSKDFDKTFEKWLERSTGTNNFSCINMYAIKNQDSVRTLLKQANGIIISGGEDINPALYGKKSELSRCGEIDQNRDSLEQMMIRFAVNRKVPLLGICRGHQILNVTQGGSLIIDIPTDVGSLYLHRDSRNAEKNKSTAVNHMVYIKKGTFLYNIVKIDSGLVYSNHHQAIEQLAPFFAISSVASDGIAESSEPVDTLLHPFILGVQWHPEAMDTKSPLSGAIGRKFMKSVNSHFLSN